MTPSRVAAIEEGLRRDLEKRISILEQRDLPSRHEEKWEQRYGHDIKDEK
jgi:hypothetical protein